MRGVLTWPQRWFAAIVRQLEHREYNVLTVLHFCLFVGIARYLLEWLGGLAIWNVPYFALAASVFYFKCFFLYGLVLKYCVDQPWRQSINVVLIGVFLGLFPPIIEFLLRGAGNFQFRYFMDFPRGWSLLLYNPEKFLPLGEALALWATVLLTAAYVAHKTKKWLQSLIALLAAYAIATFIAGVEPALSRVFAGLAGEQLVGQRLFLVLSSLYFAVFAYLLLQPNLARNLVGRSLHAAPFLAILLCGYAFVAPLAWDALVYAAILQLLILVALAQNDYFDGDEDRGNQRLAYVDKQDVYFFTIVGAATVLALQVVNTITGMTLGLFFVASVLYSFSFYRAKAYFPANLKIEGVWGLAAFATGMIAAIERQTMGDAIWSLTLPSGAARAGLTAAMTDERAWTMFFVFGGWSLISVVKDYKDWPGDLAAGVQTPYTLVERRGYGARRLHALLLPAVSVLTALPSALLVLLGRFPAPLGPLSMVFALGGYVLLRGLASPVRFRFYLLWSSLHFFVLAVALSWLRGG